MGKADGGEGVIACLPGLAPMVTTALPEWQRKWADARAYCCVLVHTVRTRIWELLLRYCCIVVTIRTRTSKLLVWNNECIILYVKYGPAQALWALKSPRGMMVQKYRFDRRKAPAKHVLYSSLSRIWLFLEFIIQSTVVYLLRNFSLLQFH